MSREMKNIMRSAIFALAAVTVGVASAETVVSAETEPFRLSIKHDGIRESGGEETLTYGANWHGGDGATVTLTQDGAELVSGLTGEGTNLWSVSRNGTYVLTHQTIENGDVTNILTATFVVSGREIPVAELTVDWDATEGLVYDGAGKMPAAVVKIGDEILERGVAYTITYEGNTNAGTAKAILMGIDPYTGAVTNEFTIASRAVTLTSASREWTYDGAAHSDEAITIGGMGFAAGEGVTTNGFATITNVGTAPNAFSYAFASGTKAENYAVTCVTGTLSVVKAVLPPVDDPDPIDPSVDPEDPAQREDPDVCFSAFDYVGVYDGDEHTIDTNALKAAYADKFLGNVPSFSYATTSNGVYQADAFAFTDVIVTSFWYKVSAANFDDIVHPCKVAITNRAVTLTSASREWTYDGAAHSDEAITIGGMGFVAGEGVTTNGFATITNVGTAPNAFSYAFASGTKAENYAVTCVTGTLSVVKAVLPPVDDPDPIDPGVDPEDPEQREDPDVRFSAFDYVGVYDGEAHTIDTNALKAAYADKFLGNVPSFSYATTSNGVYQADAFAFTDAIVTSFWYKVSAANFDDVVHPCKVAITKRPVTVTVTGHTVTPFYDTTEKSVSGYDISTEDELYDVETMTTFSGAAAAKRTDVGTTTMGLAAGQFANTDTNFDVTYDVTDGGVTIVARVIGDDDANWDIRLDKAPMYNGEEQNAPIIQVCYVKPDGNLDYIPYELEGNVATNAGNYKVKIIGKGNYSGSVEKDWAIMPRNVTLTSGSAVWEYDGTTHVTNVVEVSGDGFVDGEGATYAGFPEVTHVADAATPVDNAFTYTLNENTKAQNYVINVVKGTVKMTKRPVTLTAPTKTKTYDGTALTFAAAEVEIGGEGYADGEAFTFSNFASIIEAGQTAATFAIADGTALQADYDITITQGATLTVTKSAAEITITAKNGEWTYDGVAHTLHEYEATNLGTLLAGDELEVTFDEASVVTTPVDGEGHNGQVENKIVSVKVIRTSGTVGASGMDVTANYTLAWYPGMLTVEKRPVTLTSKDAAKTYDGTPLTKHEVEVGGDGFVGDDGASYEFTGSQTERGKSANAFTYKLDEGTNAAYYDITKVEGELEVTAADIGEAEDDDWQVALGPALTYTGIAQIQTVTSVQFKGLGVDYSVTGNQQTDAGVYEMTLAGQGNFTGTKKVAWAIAPKALTLTAGSATKTYDGTPLVSGAVTADGFVAGESATYACTGSLTDVGSSENAVGTITWTAAKESNYAVTKKPGTLTVTTRPVKVTSKNVSKPYDGTALALTAADVSADNIVAGESFVYSDFASRTEAGQTSATFSVAAGANTKLSNYAITPVYGTITITKSATEIGVTAASETWTYDGEAHSNRTWTATNLDVLQPGEELVVTFKETSVVSTPKDGPAADGKVANEIESIRVVKDSTQDVTDNYTVTPYPGLLTVEKRPVTVTVTGKTVTATYDGEEHTASGYDISTDDELYDIETMTAFGGSDEVSRTDVGKSEMGLKAGDFTNSDECFDVTYSVTDGSVEIAPADITVGLEDDFVITLGVNPKYNGTVQTIPVTAVTYKGLPVTCDLAGENATHAGTYTLTVKAKGNFSGERSVTWQILKRQVTLTSGSASRVYNGQPLVNGAVTVSGDGFIGVEGATFETSGSQTAAGSTKNTFAYTLKAGTLAGDYDITKVEGDLTVTKATFDPRSVFPGLETATDEEGILCERVFNGKPQQFEVEVSESFTEAYEILYAVTPGAWSSVAPTQTNVSEGDLKVLFRFVSANFEPYEGFGTLRIVPKELTNEFIGLVLPPEDYVYDGTEKKPEVSYGDGDPSILTEADFDVSYANNVNAGTATATFTGKGNYYSECTEDFNILKADVTDGGGEPGEGSVPPGGVSKFDATYEYDGETHTIKTNEIVSAFAAKFAEKGLAAPSAVKYSMDWNGTDGSWSDAAPGFVDVIVTSVWYKVCSADANYEDFTHESKLTITPRDLANVTVPDIGDQTHIGTAIEPTVTVTDGDPSIVTADDYDIVYSDNVEIGEATVTLTGKHNYTGTKVAHFQIVGDSAAIISAQVAWTLLKASGTYLGQLKVTCTSGLASGIDKLEFLFADRMNGGDVVAALWDTPHRAAKATTVTYGGETYRFVALDPSLITAENVPVTFGVNDLAATTIPVAERTIELYVKKRVDPTNGNAATAGVDDFVGYVGWVSGGVTNYLPVVAGAQAASLARASLVSAAPMRLSAVNTALAVGTVVDAESSPYCKLVEFAVDGDEIVGRVEVGAVTDAGTESVGAIGDNATVELLGAKTLAEGFDHLATVKTDDKGYFRIKRPGECQFFKLKLSISNVVD